MKMAFGAHLVAMILLCAGTPGCGRESPKDVTAKVSNPKDSVAGDSQQQINQITLPPNESRAADTIAMLRADANLGNPKAACRLAIELDTCRRSVIYKEFLEGVDGQQDHSAEMTDILSVDPIQSAKRSLARLERHCESVSDSDYANAFTYQKNAASRSPQLMRWLVASPSLNRNEFLSNLEEWSEYKALAEAYVQKAIRDADSDSYFTLVFAYQPKSELSRAIPIAVDDEGMFVALVELGTRNGVRLPRRILDVSNKLKVRPSVLASAQEKSRLLDMYGWGRKSIDAPTEKSSRVFPDKSLCVQI